MLAPWNASQLLVYDVDLECIAVQLDRCAAADAAGGVIMVTCKLIDGSELARLPVARDLDVTTLCAMLANTMQVACWKLRLVLPDGTCLGDESANASLIELLG